MKSKTGSIINFTASTTNSLGLEKFISKDGKKEYITKNHLHTWSFSFSEPYNTKEASLEYIIVNASFDLFQNSRSIDIKKNKTDIFSGKEIMIRFTNYYPRW